LPITQASTDQLVWMCSSPKYALRSGLGCGFCSAFDIWAVDCADFGPSDLLQEIIAPVLRRSNAKATFTATAVFIKTPVFLIAAATPAFL
jgi:hypothetical protein